MHKSRVGVMVLCLLLVGPGVNPVEAASPIRETKLTAGDVRDAFGRSVGVSGDTIAIGAELADGAMDDMGAAYIFRRSGENWVPEAKLTAADVTSFDGFGGSVGISGDTVVVGADKAGPDGAAYVFRRVSAGWIEEAKLTPAEGGLFGNSVAISGDVIVVGANGFSELTPGGKAHVFRRLGSAWIEEAVLSPSDGVFGDNFGLSVAIDDETIVVGAYTKDSDVGNSSGAAYVFRRGETGWFEEAKLTASDASGQDLFGTSVAVDGRTIAVGATGSTDGGGAVYVFKRDEMGWMEEAKLRPSDTSESDAFGSSVALLTDVMAIGDSGHAIAGAAYIFRRSGAAWVEQIKLVPSDASFDSISFGASVSIDGDAIVVGAPVNLFTSESLPGAAYVYEPRVVPFDALMIERASLGLDRGATEDGFRVVGSFSLRAGSDGFDPLSQAVTVKFGDFVQTIPAGSFVRIGNGFQFNGDLGGVTQMTIRDDFRFDVAASGLDLGLTEINSSVPFSLRIGDDIGQTVIPFEDGHFAP